MTTFSKNNDFDDFYNATLFWTAFSNPYEIEFKITSLTEILELPNIGVKVSQEKNIFSSNK